MKEICFVLGCVVVTGCAAQTAAQPNDSLIDAGRRDVTSPDVTTRDATAQDVTAFDGKPPPADRTVVPESGTSDGPAGACRNDTAIVLNGSDTGMARCDGPIFHRVKAGVCPSIHRDSCHVEGGSGTCITDLDCPRGRVCRQGVTCNCTTADNGPRRCETDAECSAGDVCACLDNGGGYCAKAICTTDSDCPSGSLCVLSSSSTGSVLACQSKSDECTIYSDCPTDEWSCCWTTKRECIHGSCGP